jgi:hypothetical protein
MKALSLLLIGLLLICCSCAVSDGIDNDEDKQLLDMDLRAGTPGEIELDLYGPSGGGSAPVSYYVFGSDIDLGNETSVPLQNFRKEEALLATLALGESSLGVDVSAWYDYEHVYIRAVPPHPQIIIELAKGTHYTFSTN